MPSSRTMIGESAMAHDHPCPKTCDRPQQTFSKARLGKALKHLMSSRHCQIRLYGLKEYRKKQHFHTMNSFQNCALFFFKNVHFVNWADKTSRNLSWHYWWIQSNLQYPLILVDLSCGSSAVWCSISNNLAIHCDLVVALPFYQVKWPPNIQLFGDAKIALNHLELKVYPAAISPGPKISMHFFFRTFFPYWQVRFATSAMLVHWKVDNPTIQPRQIEEYTERQNQCLPNFKAIFWEFSEVSRGELWWGLLGFWKWLAPSNNKLIYSSDKKTMRKP